MRIVGREAEFRVQMPDWGPAQGSGTSESWFPQDIFSVSMDSVRDRVCTSILILLLVPVGFGTGVGKAPSGRASVRGVLVSDCVVGLVVRKPSAYRGGGLPRNLSDRNFPGVASSVPGGSSGDAHWGGDPWG